MTAKEFLSQGRAIDARIDRKTEERDRLYARLTAARGANLTGMPRGGRNDWTDAVAAVIALDDQIKAEIMALCALKRQINDAIAAVEDLRFRRLLELRYRNYMGWDAIAREMGYDVRHIYRLHGLALQAVRVPEEEHSEG